MKLFILTLTLLCFSQAEPVNQQKLNELGYCAEYTIENGVITGCKTCHTGFKFKSENEKICVFNTQTSYPAKECDANGKCTFYDIRYDGANGVCSNKIDLVDANGNTVTGLAATCLACAKFNGQNSCAECATGYILNGDKCVPLSINPFGKFEEPIDNTNTNKYCIHGQYESNEAKCHTCTGDYRQDKERCILAQTNNIIPGCIEKLIGGDGKYECKKCRPGYYLSGTTCNAAVKNCEIVNNEGSCIKCLDGYYLPDGGKECTKCQILNSQPEDFKGDICNLIPEETCSKCNQNCEVNDKHMCVSKHCDLFNSENTCVRCEQGYVLNANGKCVECNEDCRNKETKLCEKGYYEANENNQKVCKKCEGNCIECYSDKICKEGKFIYGSGYALNGMPCFDSNCDLCTSEDQHICLKCKQGSDSTLIGGRCYPKAVSNFNVLSASPFTACRYYPEVTLQKGEISTMQTQLDKSFSRDISIAFEHSLNTALLCEYHDSLPYYFQRDQTDNNKIKCIGANRNEYDDCECKEGYYAEDVHKFSDCKKFEKFPHCAKPFTADFCGKCKEGLTLVNYGTSGSPEWACGCPSGERPNENGNCVKCSKYCASCRTIDVNGQSKEKCLSCKGKGSAENNFNRDLNNLCQCLEGYADFKDEGVTAEVYACNEIPKGCKDYTPSMFVVNCNDCLEEGFSSNSGCTNCKEGYRKTSDGKCKMCPKFKYNEKEFEFSACTSCESDTQCSVCNDPNMNEKKNCNECLEGYVLKFKNVSNVIQPFCMACNAYCKVEGTNNCYYGDDNICLNRKANDEYGSYSNPYDGAKIESGEYSIYCDVCKDNGQNACDQCKCDGDKLRIDADCVACSSLIKNFDETCDKSAGCEEVQDENTGKKIYKCKKCSNNYNKRSTKNNCLTCTVAKEYPVKAANGNGGCEGCRDICATCINNTVCETCVAPYATGANCDTCQPGYYKKGTYMHEQLKISLTDCDKCDSYCSLCSGNAKNCSSCSDDYHLVLKGKGCSKCIDGYYYHPFSKDCVKVSTTKGYVESELACKLTNNSLVDCRLVVEQNIPTENIQYFERAVKCDSSIKGVAAEPVDGKCVCKKGFFDTRTAEQIALSPRPECIDVRNLTSDDFCVHAKNNNGKYECLSCNAEYLELVNGKCTCKKGYYTSSWGACIPCNRHMKGCTECEKCVNGERGDQCFNKKPTCKKCESGYTLQNGECKA